MLLAHGHGHVPSPLSFIQSLSQGMAQLSQIFIYYLLFIIETEYNTSLSRVESLSEVKINNK